MRVGLVAELFLAVMCWTVFGEDADHAKVDQVFAAYNHANSPGCAVGVIRGGRFVYRRGYGMGSIELGVPLSPSSIFYMGSVSKQFTAASVVMAAKKGFLSLDDDVRKYIPELPDYGHTITLREMLHHTSGFRDFLTPLTFAGRAGSEIHTDTELIDLIARQKGLNNVPGERLIYSNHELFSAGRGDQARDGEVSCGVCR
jgi:CubicO group peptidase (beta-lactamase class C family)